MKGSQKNIQNTLAKESIFTALMILMSKKNFNEISITELTNKAGVSRMAFYRNYSFKEDIIMQHINDEFLQYRDELLDEKVTVYNVALLFFSYAKKHVKLIRNLIDSKMEYLILESYDIFLAQLFHKFVRAELLKKEIYKLEFISGGLCKILIAWIKNDLHESEEEMADIVATFAKNASL